MKKLIKIIASAAVLGIGASGICLIDLCLRAKDDYAIVKKSEVMGYWADRTGIGNSNNIVELPEAINLMNDIRENKKFYVFGNYAKRFPTKESAIEYAMQNFPSNSDGRILEIDRKGEISAEFYTDGERYFPPEKK